MVIISKILCQLEKNFSWFFYNGQKEHRCQEMLNKKYPSRDFKKIAVTGGAGFIGSHLVKYLSEKNYEVTVIDSLTYAGNLKNLDGIEHEFSLIDINDKAALKHFFQDKTFDAIVHLAAESHVDRSIENSSIFLETNIGGTVNLLEIALEQKQKNSNFFFYHVSTDEVFGSLPLRGLKKFKEKTSYDPRSPYSASKASSDHFVRAYHHTFNLPVLISNCSNNYGSNQHAEKFIPVIIENLKNRKPIPLYGNGANKRDWIHVEDHVKAIHTIMKKGTFGETYCIGGNNTISNLNLVIKICKIYDNIQNTKNSEKLISFVEDRKGHDLKYAVNSSKLRILGWKPRIKLEKGLESLIKKYLN